MTDTIQTNPIVLAGLMYYISNPTETFQFTITANGSFGISDAKPADIVYTVASEITPEAKDTFQDMNETANLELELPNTEQSASFMETLAANFRFTDPVTDPEAANFNTVRVTFYGPGNAPEN